MQNEILLGKIIELHDELGNIKHELIPVIKGYTKYDNFLVEVGPPYQDGSRLTLTIAEFYGFLIKHPLI